MSVWRNVLDRIAPPRIRPTRPVARGELETLVKRIGAECKALHARIDALERQLDKGGR